MTVATTINLAMALVFTLSAATYSHAGADSWNIWDEVIQENVSAEGFVNYNAIAATGKIDLIIELIATTDPKSLVTTTDKLTFYINSYNALVIKTILDGKSPSNIFSRISFFNGPEYNVAGQSLNLNDLEHKIIRPLNEPRIHFALVCAALSCPKLLNTIYTAPKLEEQFDTATSQFINNIDRNHFDREKKVAHLSKIFDWFSEDFQLNGSSIPSFIAGHVNDKALATELLEGNYKIEHNNYYWSLNGEFED
jgi:hypothetical protein